MKISKKLEIDSRMFLQRSNDNNELKCDFQEFNCTKYSPKNQVGGLPGALNREFRG